MKTSVLKSLTLAASTLLLWATVVTVGMARPNVKALESSYAMMTCATTAEVFINEIHYDNDGTDVNEFVEVAVANSYTGDLSNIVLTLYNGSNGTSYNSQPLSAFTEGASDANFTYYTFVFPTNGIQNGAPDGLSLSCSSEEAVIQFLSYEGSFTATDGPAAGETSTDIGVSETTSTPAAQSLQLTGTGCAYEDFSWTGPLDDSPGAPNAGQVIDGCDDNGNECSIEVVVNSTPSSCPGALDGTITIEVIVTGVDNPTLNFDLQGTAMSSVFSSTSLTQTLTIAEGMYTLSVAVAGEEGCEFETTLTVGTGTAIVINEIDYDQPLTDDMEFIELYNPCDMDVSLDGFVLELVNGASGGAAVYTTVDLTGFVIPANGYFVVCGMGSGVANCDLEFNLTANNVQNGAPDAVGLRLNGQLIDAVSYEGDVPGYTEGTGVGLVDDGGAIFVEAGLSRIPNGQDTDNNAADFQLECITPGEANVVGERTTYYADFDEDGFGDPNNTVESCASEPPFGYTTDNTDCDDDDDTVFPGAPELCDGKDNDCNGTIDDDYARTEEGLPCGFETMDMGCDAAATYTNGDAFVITSNNCNPAPPYRIDEFAYVKTTLCGDGEIIAQVNITSGIGWAGLIMREPGSSSSRKVQLSVNNFANQNRREIRTSVGGTAYPQTMSNLRRSWIRIKRTGNQFTLYTSSNGSYWIQNAVVNIAGMPTCLEAGLVVFGSGSVTAEFSNVQIIGGNTINRTAPGAITTLGNTVSTADFLLTPNPTGGVSTLTLGQEWGTATVKVLDVTGRTVLARQFDATQQTTLDLSLTDQPAGMYLVQVQAADGLTLTKRLVVARP